MTLDLSLDGRWALMTYEATENPKEPGTSGSGSRTSRPMTRSRSTWASP